MLDNLTAARMLDVHFPTSDGCTLILSRYTELNADQKLLVKRLKLDLASQSPPRITVPAHAMTRRRHPLLRCACRFRVAARPLRAAPIAIFPKKPNARGYVRSHRAALDTQRDAGTSRYSIGERR
jgi:hypothetical protein